MSEGIAFDSLALRRSDANNSAISGLIVSHDGANNPSTVVQMPQITEDVQDAGISKEVVNNEEASSSAIKILVQREGEGATCCSWHA
ncbi:hypothetical protein C8R44DRAFT_65739 [Mycena epipterygia]|nr:hypothetical protein C8R44DRAFT_65739 [Mycena epipterygia]